MAEAMDPLGTNSHRHDAKEGARCSQRNTPEAQQTTSPRVQQPPSSRFWRFFRRPESLASHRPRWFGTSAWRHTGHSRRARRTADRSRTLRTPVEDNHATIDPYKLRAKDVVDCRERPNPAIGQELAMLQCGPSKRKLVRYNAIRHSRYRDGMIGPLHAMI